MKRLTLAAALLAASSTAYAADLPSRRAPPVFVPPPIPVFSWTGFYIGGQVGYGWGMDVNTATLTAPGGANATFFYGLVAPRPNGLIGGGHIGYNFSTQSLGLGGLGGGLFGGGLVLGVEGDIDGTDFRSPLQAGVGAPGGLLQSHRSQIQGSARGRLGIAVDRALFYVTGGAAFTQFQDSYQTFATFDTLTHTRVGYTVGGGMEYAVTTNWSLRAEYRYTDWGSYTDRPAALNAGFPFTTVIRHKDFDNRVQLGFSYKFADPIAPVVARY